MVFLTSSRTDADRLVDRKNSAVCQASAGLPLPYTYLGHRYFSLIPWDPPSNENSGTPNL